MHRHIVSNPNRLQGKPYLGGARLTVDMILDEFTQHKSIRDIIRKFPQLTEEDIIFALRYAIEVVNKHPEDAHIQREF